MRSWHIFWLAVVPISASWGADSGAPFVVQVPDPKEEFRIADLTPEQKDLCAAFRAQAGEYRKPALDAALGSGALPLDQKRVRKEQIVELLGSPESESPSRMVYSLGFKDGVGYACAVQIVDGRAWLFAFTKTL